MLIVDDDPIVAESIADFLTSVGCRTVTAHGGRVRRDICTCSQSQCRAQRFKHRKSERYAKSSQQRSPRDVSLIRHYFSPFNA